MTSADVQAATEAKRSREVSQFFAYQRRILRSGLPQPGGGRLRDDRREEAELFKAAHVSAGINFKKYDDIPVERKGGQGAEEPVESFQDFCDKYTPPEDLVANIERCGYQVPTPVQKHSMSASCGGVDVMVSAQTGSGKTAAFLVPTITGTMRLGAKALESGPVRPSAVVLAPTRELCQQIAFEAKRLCFRSPCRVVSIYGGQDAMPQLQALAEGCELAICTPGRLDDFLGRGVISMEEVKYLVLDEADRMLDMGFEPQIRRIIEENRMPPAGSGEGCRQTMMFSATFPREIQDLARDFLDRNYLWISVGRVGATSSSVQQRFEDVSRADEEEKFQVLLEALQQVKAADGGAPKTIVFANQKSVVSDVAWRLSASRVRAREIHGGLSQPARDRALNDLRTGRAQVLVATDVAARGLDLPGIDHVVNYQLALNTDDYVHRIGRTGRMGNTGVATSFVGSAEPALKDLVKTLRTQAGEEGGTPVPQWMEALARRQGGGGQGRGRSRSAPPRSGGGYDSGRYGVGRGGYGGPSRQRGAYGGGGSYGRGASSPPRTRGGRGGDGEFRRRSFGDDDLSALADRMF